MNLLGRLLFVLVRALLGRRLPPLGTSTLRFTVLPHDLDLNGHMNNGRFATIMDLGRVDVGVRVGLLGTTLRRRWLPVIGNLMIRFRRSLPPFARYELQSRVIGWDDKWFVFEQRFVRRGELCAIAHVRAVFRGRGRTIPPAEVLAAAGLDATSPPLPAFVARWGAAEEEAYAEARRQEGPLG